MISTQQRMHGLPEGVVALRYIPTNGPKRLLDTRVAQPACITPGAQLGGGSTTKFKVPSTCTGVSPFAKLVVGRVAVVSPAANGFLTLWPGLADAPFPTAASVNYATVDPPVDSEFFQVLLSRHDQSFSIYASAACDVIIDLFGYFVEG